MALGQSVPSVPSRYSALITAGGIGTRLLPFSKEIPKEMFPIFDSGPDGSVHLKPVAQAIFEQLHGLGMRSFIFVVGRGKRSLQDHFTSDRSFLQTLHVKGKKSNGLRDFYEKIQSSSMVFLNQPEPLGFGDAVLRGRGFISETFVVHAGDSFVISREGAHLGRMVSLQEKYGASATILLREVVDPRAYGVVGFEPLESGVVKILEAVEKPEEPRSNLAIMPVYIFNTEIFGALARTEPGKGGELQLTDGIQRLLEEGRRVIGVKLLKDELLLDIGSPETMMEALKLSSLRVEAARRRRQKTWSTPLRVVASARRTAAIRAPGRQ